MTTFNGWTNRETWNVTLWIRNDEPLYRAMRATEPTTPRAAEQFVRGLFRDGQTPYGDSLDLVNWAEVAAAFAEDCE